LKRGGKDAHACRILYIVMRKLHQWDIFDMPLPTFIEIVKGLREEADEMEKEMRRVRR